MITRYLVSYDIRDPERLRRVHAIVSAAGTRVQYSVYEALMTLRERVLLEGQLRAVMSLTEDQVLFLDLGPADRIVAEIQSLGRAYAPQSRGAVIV